MRDVRVRHPPTRVASTASAASIHRALLAQHDPARALGTQRYFKTGPGEYGEGDRFLGIPVPALRRTARDHRALAMRSVMTLLRSSWHEERQLALFILVWQFEHGTESEQADIYARYLQHTQYINNWDLVDCSAPQIVGGWLLRRDRWPLETLRASSSVWERRIAVLATFAFVKQGEFACSLRLAQCLLTDTHDLIHKAVGWMLRDIGDGDRATLERFLDQHVSAMPRTMLRYAIEHFPDGLRRAYLAR